MKTTLLARFGGRLALPSVLRSSEAAGLTARTKAHRAGFGGPRGLPMASNAALGACIGCSKPFRTRGEIFGVPATYRKLHPGLPASAGVHKACAGRLRAKTSGVKAVAPVASRTRHAQLEPEPEQRPAAGGWATAGACAGFFAARLVDHKRQRVGAPPAAAMPTGGAGAASSSLSDDGAAALAMEEEPPTAGGPPCSAEASRPRRQAHSKPPRAPRPPSRTVASPPCSRLLWTGG